MITDVYKPQMHFMHGQFQFQFQVGRVAFATFHQLRRTLKQNVQCVLLCNLWIINDIGLPIPPGNFFGLPRDDHESNDSFCTIQARYARCSGSSLGAIHETIQGKRCNMQHGTPCFYF